MSRLSVVGHVAMDVLDQAVSGLLGLWQSVFGVSPQEHVVGGADALECLNQHGDDPSDDVFVVSLREPKAMQFNGTCGLPGGATAR